MIYTVTLNPTLDITYVLEEISYDESVKALEVVKTPGGKGVNVSRVLKAMGTDSVTMALIGGFAGAEALDLLHREGLILQIVRIEANTRTNVIVLGRRNGLELVIRAAGPPVEDREIDRISDLIMQTTRVPEMIVLSGSLPRGVDNDAYYRLAMEGKSRGAKVILDSGGKPLRAGIKAAPLLIKPNLAELEELAGCELEGRRQILDFCGDLLSGGIEIVVVSLGREGAMLVTGDVALKGTVPFIDDDTVGAGDSMVAGMVMGLTRSLPMEEVFHMGLACSVATVINTGPGLTTRETYAEAFPQIGIEQISMA
ncbi:MAG: 1-phosphofructokinase family hexose kinase [Actinobacteria bacterium]|nr:1-phosphofructokinase family hexose kinase [Actinomycetota bacterium]